MRAQSLCVLPEIFVKVDIDLTLTSRSINEYYVQ
jgi:hypothetical protein